MSKIADIIANVVRIEAFVPAEHAAKVAPFILSAFEEAGFVVVPKEPTDAMTKAFSDLFWEHTGYGMDQDGVRRYIAAMAEARPK